jgi:hypothetical protein
MSNDLLLGSGKVIRGGGNYEIRLKRFKGSDLINNEVCGRQGKGQAKKLFSSGDRPDHLKVPLPLFTTEEGTFSSGPVYQETMNTRAGEIGNLFFEQFFMNLSIFVNGRDNSGNDSQRQGFVSLF